jgi:hypothetical protein
MDYAAEQAMEIEALEAILVRGPACMPSAG